MSISKIFRESIAAAKGNPLIFIPMLVASVFSALLSLIFAGSAVPMMGALSTEQMAENPEQALAGFGVAAGSMFLIGLLSGLVGLLTHSMTVAMADTALKGERATLQNGWSRLVTRIVPVIIASVLMGIIVGVGFLLLILPGVILAFFLMFTLVALMVDNLGAFKAIGQSFKTVGKNFGATFITFLVILGLGILTGIASFIVALIPLLGVVLSMLIYALFTGFITIFVVRVYRDLAADPDAPPEVEV